MILPLKFLVPMLEKEKLQNAKQKIIAGVLLELTF